MTLLAIVLSGGFGLWLAAQAPRVAAPIPAAVSPSTIAVEPSPRPSKHNPPVQFLPRIVVNRVEPGLIDDQGTAEISIDGGAPQRVGVGAEFADGAAIESIDRNGVVMLRDGRRTLIAPPPQTLDSGTIKVPNSESGMGGVRR